MNVEPTEQARPDQFYTGLVAHAYGPLRNVVAPIAPYERFVRRFGEPALELGCGHGEPLLDLIAAGLDVAGLDSSGDMLALCRAEANRRGLAVDLFCQPMESMSIDRRFRSIYLAGPTFQLVVDIDNARRALARIRSHLEPEGRAFVPLFRPQPTPSNALDRWKEHTTPEGVVLAIQTAAQSFRAEQRRVDTKMRYRRGPVDDPIEVLERTWSLRWYEEGEFETLAELAGLRVDRVLDHAAFGRSFILAPNLDG